MDSVLIFFQIARFSFSFNVILFIFTKENKKSKDSKLIRLIGMNIHAAHVNEMLSSIKYIAIVYK